MTVIFPLYHTPVSASNGAYLLCDCFGGGVFSKLTFLTGNISSHGFPLRDVRLYDLPKVLPGVFGRFCCFFEGKTHVEALTQNIK